MHDLAPGLTIQMLSVRAVERNDVPASGGERGCRLEIRSDPELPASIALLDGNDGKVSVSPYSSNMFGTVEAKSTGASKNG